MKAVIQRVAHAGVTIEGALKASVGKGLLVLLGVGYEDGADDIRWLVRKISGLRIFDDEKGVMNRSVVDVDGEVIVVSQFTLMADCRRGNRPSYINAANHEIAIPLYLEFCRELSEAIGKKVQTGEFGADMKVELLNDGPVTICLDSKEK
ncbi:MAG: D-aminoacyl-tRNA deacylase [Bacteroidales bacterium]|uniref:D-aminoacyl-tRNA deacylase n=1 Tax=Candidatus Cryptobacteroides sp. TaxID=2952915 RepID=UPI002A760FE0|nr:D-aminoacyl-tRNA deacylase [Candidatus Cryptobacteroides sp.]MCI6525821.1 D-aminoacyl-tRNA deacylase [Bacteroidales bacterium]MDD7234831.1 D-aminoacyl-tRNA deacylase [Bacteroidales bacterium]MDD7624382.1 D-aminoacyl-tRNA deacylase [Bacteroidales bacterium]MDY2702545.1 D-aminoacyl-tRNA deacylase [Candidatus Cryptobacteroides sp.]MDY3879245.1 D-aminoacyl-tRNA deacylase [Candidatus Cryptobacteroides sp.]